MCGSFLEQVLRVGFAQARCLVGNLAQAFFIGLACLILCAVSVAPAYSMTVGEMRDKVPYTRLYVTAKPDFDRIEQQLNSVPEAQQKLVALRNLISTAKLSYEQANGALGTVISRLGANSDKTVTSEEKNLANQADLDTQAVENALAKLQQQFKTTLAAPAGPVQPPGYGSSSLTIKAMAENLNQLKIDINPESATETVIQFERQWGSLPEAKSQIENTRALINQAKTAYNDAAKAYNASYNAAPDETKPISKGDEELVYKASAAAVALKTSLGRLKDFKPAVQPYKFATVPHLGWSALDGYTELMIISIVLLLLLVALWLFFSQSKITYNKPRYPDGSKGSDGSPRSKLGGIQGSNDDQGRPSQTSFLSRWFGGEERMQMQKHLHIISNNFSEIKLSILALNKELEYLVKDNKHLKEDNETFKGELKNLYKALKKDIETLSKAHNDEITSFKRDIEALNAKFDSLKELLTQLIQKNTQEIATPQIEPVRAEQIKPPKLDKPPEAEPDNPNGQFKKTPSDVSFIHLEHVASVTKVILEAIEHQPDGETKPYYLLGTIIEQLQKHIPAQTVGKCQTYDLEWKPKEDLWFYLLYEFPETDASGEKNGLLFIASEVNTSARVIDYFKGGKVSNKVKRVLEPAHVKVGTSLPPTVVSHGTVE